MWPTRSDPCCLLLGLSLGLTSCATGPESHERSATPSEAGAEPEGMGPPINRRKSQSDETLRAYLDPRRDEWNRPGEVIQTMDIQPGETICDLGAGSGYFTFRLAEATGPTGQVLAHDVDPRAVQMLQERVSTDWNSETMGPISVVQNPYDDPMLEQESVDKMLMVDVHFASDEELRPLDAATMSKLFSGMKPGGTIWYIEQQGDPQTPREDGQKRAATLANFTSHGFVLRDEYQFVRNHFFLSFERADTDAH